MEIFIELDIGTPGQTLRILLDSGSDWLWVTTSKCIECGGVKRFDSKESSTYELVSEDEIVLSYGSGDAWGSHIRETVCLSTTTNCDGYFCEQACVTDMNMLGIYGQGRGLQALVSDGLIGLSPVKIGDDRPDLYIDLAVKQGVLDERVFSLNFSGDYETSYVTFGGYDEATFAVEPITWHENVGDYFWAVNLEEVNFVSSGIKKKYGGSAWRQTDTIVDSGSSYLLMPQDAFWDFFDEIEKTGTKCTVDWWNTLYCDYDEALFDILPELEFTIDNKIYTVPRESLYVPLNYGGWDKRMAVEVTYIKGWNEWLFGLTFLENYYAVYDMDQQRMGFALSKTGPMAERHGLEAPISLLQGEQQEETATSDWQKSSLMSASVLLPMAVGFMLYRACRSKARSATV